MQVRAAAFMELPEKEAPPGLEKCLAHAQAIKACAGEHDTVRDVQPLQERAGLHAQSHHIAFRVSVRVRLCVRGRPVTMLVYPLNIYQVSPD